VRVTGEEVSKWKELWSYPDVAMINDLHLAPYKINGSVRDMHAISACRAMTATPSARTHQRAPTLLLIQR
jgi:hypothetical protein